MRILIATVPHVAHLYIVVPYAQALQNAGHEVCIATPPGGETPAIEAGLPAVTFGEQVPLSLQNWKKYGHLPSQEVRERYAQAFGFDRAERDHQLRQAARLNQRRRGGSTPKLGDLRG